VDVFPAGQFQVEPRPHLEQRSDASANHRPPVAGLGNARHDFEKRTFAGAIAANQPDRLSATDIQVDVFEGPDFAGFLFDLFTPEKRTNFLRALGNRPDQRVPEGYVPVHPVTQLVTLREAFYADYDIAHRLDGNCTQHPQTDPLPHIKTVVVRARQISCP